MKINNRSSNVSSNGIKTKQNLNMYRFYTSHACIDLLNTSKLHKLKKKSNEYWICCFFSHCLGWVRIEWWTKERKVWEKENNNIKTNIFTCRFVVIRLFSLFCEVKVSFDFGAKSFPGLVGLENFLMPRDLLLSSTIFTTFITYTDSDCCMLRLYFFRLLLFLLLDSHQIDSILIQSMKIQAASFPHHFTFIEDYNKT